MAPCVKRMLMGLATFVASHLSRFIALGLTNRCVVLESKKHNTPFIHTLNLSKNKLGPNLAILAFATNPPCS